MFIISATTETDTSLEKLLDRYDRARTDDERERIASEVHDLAGGRIRAMIRRSAGAHRLDEEQLSALAWEAIHTGLSGSGVTRVKRSDGVWETFIERCRSGASGPGKKVWSLLSPRLKQDLTAPWLKSKTSDVLIKELNFILRRRDFYDPATFSGVALDQEAAGLLAKGLDNLGTRDLSRFNLLALASAFPEISAPPRPETKFLGFIAKVVVPKLKPALWEAATGRVPRQHLVEAWNALEGDIAAVDEMEKAGTLPEEWQGLSRAERVYRHQKQRPQRRFGPAIEWLTERVRELSPARPFAVRDKESLRDARELLEQSGIPELLWKFRDSRNYVPTAALHPHGIRTIENLLAAEGFRPKSMPIREPAAPAAPANAPWQSPVGQEARAYSLLVDRLFPGPQHEIERSIGHFLAGNPRPGDQQIAAFLGSLPEDAKEIVEDPAGFRSIAAEIDREVRADLREPDTREWLALMLGAGTRQASAAINAIRRHAFLRGAEFVRSVGVYKAAGSAA